MDYYSSLIYSAESDSKTLFRTITRLPHWKADKLFPTSSSAVDLANKFVHFFEEKIVNIRSNFGTPVIPDFFRTLDTSSLTCQLVNFAPTSNTELSNIANNIVMKSWSRSLTNRRFHFRSWKGRNHAFLRQFSGFYFCLSIVFRHFPVIIVQILSVEQKLRLGIEYPFKPDDVILFSFHCDWEWTKYTNNTVHLECTCISVRPEKRVFRENFFYKIWVALEFKPQVSCYQRQ